MDGIKLKKLFRIIAYIALAVALVFFILWLKDDKAILNWCSSQADLDFSGRCISSVFQAKDNQIKTVKYALTIAVISGIISWLVSNENHRSQNK